ncbi:MAG: helix-turn-helix domain-containing protein [Candidatus Peribacteria bacterium]|jgi:cytoskeletal protein RodZ|nr:helix-turn-helix domain-containing protein [Candidatus Peribacteria bacterium]
MTGEESRKRLKEIPTILRTLRENKNLTQEEIAEMTDLLVEIIEKIENGDGHIKVSNVVKYSE